MSRRNELASVMARQPVTYPSRSAEEANRKRTLEQRERGLSRYHLAVEQTQEAYPLAV